MKIIVPTQISRDKRGESLGDAFNLVKVYCGVSDGGGVLALVSLVVSSGIERWAEWRRLMGLRDSSAFASGATFGSWKMEWNH